MIALTRIHVNLLNQMDRMSLQMKVVAKQWRLHENLSKMQHWMPCPLSDVASLGCWYTVGLQLMNVFTVDYFLNLLINCLAY